MNYLVIAKRHGQGCPYFRRSGIRFSVSEPTILDETEITDAIKDEPMLIVKKLKDEPKAEELSEMIIKLQKPKRKKP